MRTDVILEAIKTLDDSARALRMGGTSIGEQMDIGFRCHLSSVRLTVGLERDHPELKTEAAQS